MNVSTETVLDDVNNTAPAKPTPNNTSTQSIVYVNEGSGNKGGIWKYFKLSNLFYLFCLYEMMPSMGKTSPASESNSVAIKQPRLEQHFIWEHIGYVQSTTAPPILSVKNTTGSEELKPIKTIYRGYYAKDKTALAGVLSSIHRSLPNVNDSCTRERDAEEFDVHPTCKKHPVANALSSSVIVLDLKLDEDPSKEVSWVRSAIDFLIGVTQETKSSLEVLVKLESGGGSVPEYGLLAEQFRRLREDLDIKLTVSCDITCASGGYLAASLASPGQLLASPFATIGSIGVTRPTILDLGDLMEAHGIKEVQIKSGARKGSLGAIGSGLTEDEIRYEQERYDAIHKVFLDHVQLWRGNLTDIALISNGDHWLGFHALDHGLVDQLITSDQYVHDKIKAGYNVISMKKLSHQNSGFFGDGASKHWIWTILDLFLHSDSEARVQVESAKGFRPLLVRVLQLLQENL